MISLRAQTSASVHNETVIGGGWRARQTVLDYGRCGVESASIKRPCRDRELRHLRFIHPTLGVRQAEFGGHRPNRDCAEFSVPATGEELNTAGDRAE